MLTRMARQGLVFTAGNADTFSRVLLTLKMLRNHLHTSLPSEIFSFPGEEPTAEIRAELEAHGATLGIVGDATRDPSRKCITLPFPLPPRFGSR